MNGEVLAQLLKDKGYEDVPPQVISDFLKSLEKEREKRKAEKEERLRNRIRAKEEKKQAMSEQKKGGKKFSRNINMNFSNARLYNVGDTDEVVIFQKQIEFLCQRGAIVSNLFAEYVNKFSANPNDNEKNVEGNRR